MPRQDLIKAIKAHALANYETGGWDFVVECYEDAEIGEELDALATDLGREPTLDEALADFGRTARLQDEQRRAVMNEVF